MIEQLGGHLATSQGQPTTTAILPHPSIVGGGGGQDIYHIRPYCPTPPLCAGGPHIPYQAALAHLWPTADAVSAPPR